jgi:hypothetical protein
MDAAKKVAKGKAKVSKKGPNPVADTDVSVRPIDPNEKLTLEKNTGHGQRS